MTSLGFRNCLKLGQSQACSSVAAESGEFGRCLIMHSHQVLVVFEVIDHAKLLRDTSLIEVFIARINASLHH